ncbi:hypothetical protein CKF54_03730 [Psittacicella hinzii]|uniref:Toprim domain-containing protein n=1 Tax=Psittacicella hinzii TaxID=2028575 RepID=A0A3A1Y3L1_9GAMM|nr:hypothetical protein [Psittacicella hinzii]RIY32922.1 hypothetical protein CKF54_03730 [Psittacicella hinzii]
MVYKRYFAVPFAQVKSFVKLAYTQTNILPFSAKPKFDYELKLWYLESSDERILNCELQLLNDYLPKHDTSSEVIDYNDLSNWVSNKLSEVGVRDNKGIVLDLSSGSTKWRRCEVLNGKRGNLDSGYLLKYNGKVVNLIIYNYKQEETLEKFTYVVGRNNSNTELSKEEKEELKLKQLNTKAYYQQKTEEIKSKYQDDNRANIEIEHWFKQNSSSLAKNSNIVPYYLLSKGLYYDDNIMVSQRNILAPVGSDVKIEIGDLIVPIYDCNSLLVKSFQIIKPNGLKRFLKNYSVKDGINFIHKKQFNKKAILCEGYATGASIKQGFDLIQCNDIDIIVCFSLHHLENIAKQLGQSCKYKEIVVLADDDRNENGRPTRDLPPMSNYNFGSRSCTVKWILPPITDEEKKNLYNCLNTKVVNTNEFREANRAKLLSSSFYKIKDFNDLYFCFLVLDYSNGLASIVNRMVSAFGA